MYRYDSLVANQSLKWYLSGVALAVGHLTFAPLVLPQIKELQGKNGGCHKPREVLSEWLYWHDIRTYTIDLAAWVCFAVAVGLNVSA